MALKDCIQRALKAGVINSKQAEKIAKLGDGQEEADREILETFIQGAQEQKRRVNLQVIAQSRNLADIAKHPEGPGRGVLALLVRDIEGKAPYSNVDYRGQSIVAELYGKFAEAMDRYRTRNLGFTQDTKGIRNMVKELFGEASGDADAAAFAKMWTDTAETARLRYNVAGGDIPKRKDWGLPHAHDDKKIADVSFDEWKDFIVPRLDRNRMYSSDGRVMGQSQFEKLVKDLYEQFTQRAKNTSTDIDRTVPNRVDHRLLTFKNAEAWLSYNDRFGEPNIYGAMTGHLEHMAGDIALQEILGPRPDATMSQLMSKAGEAGTNPLTMKLIRDAYEVVTGRVNQTQSDTIANIGSSVRNLLSAAQLGSAFISSFGDLWTQKLTRTFNGLPSIGMIKEIFSLMRPGNRADRAFAVKLGLGAEAWTTRALAAQRFQEISGNQLTARISDTLFRASLLSSWTEAGRHAFGLEFAGFLAENVGKGFKELPEALRNSLTRYGITPTHWEIIRRAPLLERDGAKFLPPSAVLELSRGEAKGLAEIFRSAAEDVTAEAALRGNRPATLRKRMAGHSAGATAGIDRIAMIRDASAKLHEMILTETDFAVPVPDARIRAMLTQGQKRGSLIGEIVRSVAMYKTFPISMITTHLYRGATQIDGLANRAKYLAELMIGLTVMGGISVQARNLLKGKDAQDMTDPRFLAQAFAQGGGAAIFQDFIFNDVNRYGGGIIQSIAGPVAGLIDDSTRLTMGNLHQFLQGKETKFLAESAQFAKRYTPGSNLWYTRVAMERLLWDQLQKAADPQAQQSFRRIMQNARRDYNQEFWWRPGETAPERAPDLGRSLGE